MTHPIVDKIDKLVEVHEKPALFLSGGLDSTIAIIGNGYWSKCIQKYTSVYFNVKYIADSKFDLNKIWKDDEISGVIIATPIDTHFKLAMEAIGAGKHVLLEKPIAMTTLDANLIRKAAKDNNVKIGIEYTQTFSKTMEYIRTNLPLIGEVRFFEMSSKHLGRFTGFNVYWLLASHHLSILDMFFKLDQFKIGLTDHTTYDNICTTGSINLLGEQVSGRIDVSLDFPSKEMYATFYGDKGTLQYTPLAEHSVVVTLFDRVRSDKLNGTVTGTYTYSADERNNLQHSMRYFCDLMNNTAESNIDSAIRITNALENS